MVKLRNNRWLSLSPHILKAKPLVHIIEFWLVSMRVTLCLLSFSHIASVSKRRPTSGACTSGMWMLEDATSSYRNLPCRKTRDSTFGSGKVSAVKSVLNIWPPNSLEGKPLYYVWLVVDRQSACNPINNKEELKARISVVFTNLNKVIAQLAGTVKYTDCFSADW